MSFSDAEIAWIQGASDKSPEAYFDKFGIEEKKRGHLRYVRLLQIKGLSDNLRKQLLDQFAIWKVDKAPQFWLNRRARLMAIRTAATLVEGSAPYAEEAILQNAATVSGILDIRGSLTSEDSSAETMFQADVNMFDEENENFEGKAD